MTDTDPMPVDDERLRRPLDLGRVDTDGHAAVVERHDHLDLLGGRLIDGTLAAADLAELLPEWFAGLELDAADAVLLDLWGTSTTVDEGVALVPAPVIELIAELTGTEPNPTSVHAGLAHTYGYLLSTTPTGFGRKRHRWSSQEAAHVLGIDGDWPLDQGRLLAAVTAALHDVAPLDRADPAPTVGPTADTPSDTDPPPAAGASTSIMRELLGAGTSEDGRPWRSRTRIVQRDTIDAQTLRTTDELLLVYSLQVGAEPERYITAFPVSIDFAEALEPAAQNVLRYLAVARPSG